MNTHSPRIAAAAFLLGYVAFLAAVLFEYHPLVATDVVSRVGSWLVGHGSPTTLTTPARVEFLLNTAMFTPVALLTAVTLPRHPLANWVVYGFVGSAAVELLQGLVLPARSAQFEDVVANTLGALIGVLVALPFVRTWATAAKPIKR